MKRPPTAALDLLAIDRCRSFDNLDRILITVHGLDRDRHRHQMKLSEIVSVHLSVDRGPVGIGNLILTRIPALADLAELRQATKVDLYQTAITIILGNAAITFGLLKLTT